MEFTSEQALKGRVVTSDGYLLVDRLPSQVENGMAYWIDSPNGRHEYTHSLFKFPAKFHPPIVRWALETYGRQDGAVFDPFTGSGTVQVESLAQGRSSVGIDIDPLACLITRVKTTPINPQELRESLSLMKAALASTIAEHAAEELSPGADITEEQYQSECATLKIPPLSSITHWFRRYVIIDIARILTAIHLVVPSNEQQMFFKACVAAVIRSVSNGDPAPVSGLEVTRMQAEKNIRRRIKVFKSFFTKTEAEINGMSELWEVTQTNRAKATTTVLQGNAAEILNESDQSWVPKDGISLVVTSPPYCRAVEYSRRHQLEMYWLGLVKNQTEHVSLIHQYTGRRLVRASDWNESLEFGIKTLDDTIQRIQAANANKARTIRHYFYSMREALTGLAKVMTLDGTVVCVVGNSVCCNIPISTADYICELASQSFEINIRLSYAIRNHHMQYGLWNGEGIKQEHVLILKPRRN